MRLPTLNRASQTMARSAFTLMELLVVVAILAVLGGVAVPIYLSYLESSRKKIARTEAIHLAGELKNFAISHDGEYPPENNWDLLPLESNKKPPLDPWNQPYQWGLDKSPQLDADILVPIVRSCGPDKIPGSGDDIFSNQ